MCGPIMAICRRIPVKISCLLGGFGQWQEWNFDASDTDKNMLSFIRKAKTRNAFLVIVSNFSSPPWKDNRIGVAHPGCYHELLNSDSERYWGSDVGIGGGQATDPISMYG